ncbi:MAG TPA: S46 family peptidase, partial [Thermoanaerobaculia bacterium]|nr:S46 family peptidase [Thermoanaerobaculia bacterium]
MKRQRLTSFLTALAALPALAIAGEGMWMPQQVPQLAGELRQMGLRIDPAKLADLTGDPLGAVVQLPGCTASFVSPDGLIVTNHHCAFGSIQYNATPERNLIDDGFLARTHAEELPAAPGTKVWVTTKIEDVTARVTGSLGAKLTDAARSKEIDRREKELLAECEKPGGVRCKVSSFFEGSQYLRQTQAEISDVRLVYAPPRAIGEFGGEVDNFEWPRHTGDFSFYRAYVDGQPYHPKHWLKVSTEGVNNGDLVIVAGYPGRTFRYKTADEVRNFKEFNYPTNIRYYTDVMAILEAASKNDKTVALRNTSRIKSLANALKNYTSVNEGFGKDRIVEARVAREDAMRKAIAGDASLAKYARTLDEIASVNAASLKTRERDLILSWLLGGITGARSSPMLTSAMQIVRVATERPRKDMDRLSGYQERDWSRIRQASDRAQRVIDAGSDRAAVRYFLVEASKLPASQRIKAIDDAVAAAGGIDPFLDRLYGGTKIADQTERTKMLGESVQQLDARNDSMIGFVKSLL